MRIRTADRIGGQPITEARKLVRRLQRDSIDVEVIMSVLSLARVPATRLLNAMIAEGYVAADEKKPEAWALTEKAGKLAHATAAPPMARAAAERLLAGVIARAEALNLPGGEFAYGVARLLVFGSYLTDASYLNDLDLAVEWLPKSSDRREQFEYD
jgi:hypothetical protein